MSLPPKDLLVPGPWKVKENTVLDAYGKTVCVVFARNATAHSYWIGEVPAFTAKIAALETTINVLEDQISELEEKLDSLENPEEDEK